MAFLLGLLDLAAQVAGRLVVDLLGVLVLVEVGCVAKSALQSRPSSIRGYEVRCSQLTVLVVH